MPRSHLGRKKPLFGQGLAHGDGIGMIHRKNDDGRPLDGGLANRIRAFPPEVSRPLVPSRIEQPGDPPREGIDPGDVRSLEGLGGPWRALGSGGPWGQTEFQVKLETRSDLAPRSSGKEDSRKLETFQMEPCG